MNEELYNIRKQYYNNPFVKNLLVKMMKNREVVFMSKSENWKCIRGMNIYSVHRLDFYFSAFNFFDKDYNIYISNGTFENFPDFTIDLKNRSNSMRDFLTNDYKKIMKKFDFLIDLDYKENPNITDIEMFQNIKDVAMLLNKFSISYSCLMSSKKGCHFIIPFEMLNKKNDFTNSDFFMELGQIIRNLKSVFYFMNYADINGISNSTKIRKCPYSLVDDFVVMPFEINPEIIDYEIDLNFHNTIALINIQNQLINKEIKIFNLPINSSNFNRLVKFMDGLIEA